MFVLKIEMGNAAVSTRDDIAELLKKVAYRMENGDGSGRIMDANGNQVGNFGRK